MSLGLTTAIVGRFPSYSLPWHMAHGLPSSTSGPLPPLTDPAWLRLALPTTPRQSGILRCCSILRGQRGTALSRLWRTWNLWERHLIPRRRSQGSQWVPAVQVPLLTRPPIYCIHTYFILYIARYMFSMSHGERMSQQGALLGWISGSCNHERHMQLA